MVGPGIELEELGPVAIESRPKVRLEWVLSFAD